MRFLVPKAWRSFRRPYPADHPYFWGQQSQGDPAPMIDRPTAEPAERPAEEPDFIMIDGVQPPPRIMQARERLLLSRLYVRLIRSLHDDYGAEFAANSDSCTLRTIGIYVFFRTLMCTPVRASTIAQALKLPKATVNRRLQEMMKHGYIERIGNAYRVTDEVNVADLQSKLQRRLDMIMETAAELSKLRTSTSGAAAASLPNSPRSTNSGS
jgi:DNA-binding MarR family transcriptional regulator